MATRNTFFDSSMRSSIVSNILSVVLSAILSISISLYISQRDQYSDAEKSSAILYSDMGESLNSIFNDIVNSNSKEYYLNVFKLKPMTLDHPLHEVVAPAPITDLGNTNIVYLKDIKSQITSKDYENIRLHYVNMKSLETLRQAYINEVNQKNVDLNKRENIFNEYYDLLWKIHLMYYNNDGGVTDTFNTLQRISKLNSFAINLKTLKK